MPRLSYTPQPEMVARTLLRFTREEVQRTTDPNPIHHDIGAAKEAGYADLVVPGLMVIERALSYLRTRRYQHMRLTGFKGLKFKSVLLAKEPALIVFTRSLSATHPSLAELQLKVTSAGRHILVGTIVIDALG